MMRKTAVWIALFMIILLGADIVLAIGVAPSRDVLRVAPGESVIQRLRIFNLRGVPVNVSIAVAGELEDFIHFNETLIEISGKEKTVNYSIELPEHYGLAGLHVSEIILKEEAPATRARGNLNLGLTAIKSRLEVYVPYPGKYLESDVMLAQESMLFGERAVITIPVHNLGTEPIEQAYAHITIIDSRNVNVHEIDTETISLDAGEDSKFTVSWLAGKSLGRHKAYAVVSYDGKSSSSEGYFDVEYSPLYDLSGFIYADGEYMTLEEKEELMNRANKAWLLIVFLIIALVVAFEAVLFVTMYHHKRRK